MVGDTKLVIKKCSSCGSEKEADKFIKQRNICKMCSNARRKELYHTPVTELERKCTYCDNTKPIISFLKNRCICKDCNNEKRREKYDNDEEHRQKLIQTATLFIPVKI